MSRKLLRMWHHLTIFNLDSWQLPTSYTANTCVAAISVWSSLLHSIVFPALVRWQFWFNFRLRIRASTEFIVANLTDVSRTWLLCNTHLPLRFTPCPLSVYPWPLVYNCNVSMVICRCGASLRSVSLCQTSIVSSFSSCPHQLQSFIAHSSGSHVLIMNNGAQENSVHYVSLGLGIDNTIIGCLSSLTPPWWPTLYFLPLSS